MSQPTTPRPITREEFEAGKKFQLADPLDGTFRLKMSWSKGRYIEKNNHGNYCMLYAVQDDGFKFIQYIFNHHFIRDIYFKDCFILSETT